MTLPTVSVRWPYHRIISSRYPPIDLFEDIADPADWALLAAAEAKSNPRLVESIGNLDKVPVQRRVSGPGASYVMAPFVHATPDRPGRFHDGHFGAFYGADSAETALLEHSFHAAGFFALTDESPGWLAEYRGLTGSIDSELVPVDAANDPSLLDPDISVYPKAQAFARQVIDAGLDGIVYPSVRHTGGTCFAAFYPDVMAIPVQADHYAYHWDGTAITLIKNITANRTFRVET